MEFYIRKADTNDVPAIKEITQKAFEIYENQAGRAAAQSALSEKSEAILEDIQTKLVYIAFAGDLPVGCVRVKTDGDEAYLSRFGVLPEYQTGGAGKLLLKAIDKDMRLLGIKRLYLHTASRVSKLIRFYYGCGFFVESVTTDKGYVRARMLKEYE